MERLDTPSTRPRWKRFFTWPKLMAFFVVLETLAICTRHYDPLYVDRIWPQIGMPLTVAFAALVVSKSELRRHPGTVCMALYFLWYLAVLILNRWFLAYEFADFRLVLYRLLFTTLVCFPLGLALGRRGRLARAVFSAFTGVFALLGAIGVYCVLAQTHWYTPYGHGALGLGYEAGTGLRLYLFAHPNISGAALMMTLLLSLYLCLTAHGKAARLWHGLCCVPMFVALGLTVSRTSMLAVSTAIALLPFLAVRRRLEHRGRRLAWGAGITCAALAAVLCFTCLNAVNWGAGQLIAADAAIDYDAADSTVPVQRELTGSDLHSVASRTRIWRQALNAVTANPRILIRGTTLERLMLVVPSPPGERFVHLHNSYLTVLLSMGAAGFALMLCFLWSLGRASLRRMFSHDASVSLGERFLPAVFLSCLLVGFMEPFYFTGQYFMDRLFYLLAGYVMARGAAERLPAK